MNKRNSLANDFENCYLRDRLAKKAFEQKQAVSDLMASPDFQKCVSYFTKIYHDQYRVVLSRYGFEYEDLKSICTVLAVQYVNNPAPAGKSQKDVCNLLMYGLGQRMDNFIMFVGRKFRVGETCPDILIDDMDAIPEFEMLIDSTKSRNTKSTYKQIAAIESDISVYQSRLSEIATMKVIGYHARKQARKLCDRHGINYIAWAKAKIEQLGLDTEDFVLE